MMNRQALKRFAACAVVALAAGQAMAKNPEKQQGEPKVELRGVKFWQHNGNRKTRVHVDDATTPSRTFQLK